MSAKSSSTEPHQPRTFSFQPDDKVRQAMTVAESLFHPLDRSGILNSALARILPTMIEERADARQRELAAIVSAYRKATTSR